MASASERSIHQNRAFWLVPERVGNQQYGPLRFGGTIFDMFQFISFLKVFFGETTFKFEMSVS